MGRRHFKREQIIHMLREAEIKLAGDNASANHYSLIETAKANRIEPYAYLRTVSTELPQATSADEIEALLPVPHDSQGSTQLS